jgi:hypothetical protein
LTSCSTSPPIATTVAPTAPIAAAAAAVAAATAFLVRSVAPGKDVVRGGKAS